MAIYKRYNTRRKRVNYPLIIWAASLAAVLIITAVVGYVLGQKADGGESYLTEPSHTADSETLASVIPHIMQAEYVEPEDLSAFASEDASAFASTWLYRDGEACFATDVQAALGGDTSMLAKKDAFGIASPVSGMFEVTSVYASENVREVICAYEVALLSEFAAGGPDEIVLVFETVTEENTGYILEFAKKVGGAVISVPYDTLYESYFAKFISAATDHGYTVALMADDLSGEQLASDIEDYAVYFTRDFLRLMLSGDMPALADVLREKNVLNYQFYS